MWLELVPSGLPYLHPDQFQDTTNMETNMPLPEDGPADNTDEAPPINPPIVSDAIDVDLMRSVWEALDKLRSTPIHHESDRKFLQNANNCLNQLEAFANAQLRRNQHQ